VAEWAERGVHDRAPLLDGRRQRLPRGGGAANGLREQNSQFRGASEASDEKLEKASGTPIIYTTATTSCARLPGERRQYQWTKVCLEEGALAATCIIDYV